MGEGPNGGKTAGPFSTCPMCTEQVPTVHYDAHMAGHFTDHEVPGWGTKTPTGRFRLWVKRIWG